MIYTYNLDKSQELNQVFQELSYQNCAPATQLQTVFSFCVKTPDFFVMRLTLLSLWTNKNSLFDFICG